MGKVTVSKLVSLIINEINEQQSYQPAEYQSSSQGADFTYIGTRQDVMKFLQGAENQPQDTQEPEPEPQAMEHPAEVTELLKQPREYAEEKLQCPMRIPIGLLHLGKKEGDRSNDPNVPHASIPSIKCLDPETGEFTTTEIIGDMILTTPSGWRFLVFQNHFGNEKVDMGGKKVEHYVLIEGDNELLNQFIKCKPRGKKYGKEVSRDIRQGLYDPKPDESEEERIAREKKLNTILEMMGKRYGIFPAINSTFSDPQVLDHLDKCLVPETWATSTRTEHTTNVIHLKKFGGSTPEINCDFVAVRDMKNVDEAINDVMDLRAELAMGGEDEDPNNPVNKRQREFSKHMPRQHANAIYANGNWHAKQRVHDPNFFEEEGGKTPVYELLSKNIQEGLMTVNIKSTLSIVGNVNDNNEYVMKATFASTLNARNLETGKGEESGNLFQPITVGLRKPIEGDYPEKMNFDDNPQFFVDQGRTTRRIPKTGYFPTLLKNLGTEIKNQIDPDAVLATMLQLVQNAVDQPVQGLQ